MPGREHPFMENPSRTLTVVNVIDFPAPFANGHEHRSDNVGLINAPFPLTKYTTWHNGTIENERPRPGCATLPVTPIRTDLLTAVVLIWIHPLAAPTSAGMGLLGMRLEGVQQP